MTNDTRTYATVLLAAIEWIIHKGQAGGPVLQVEQIYGLLTSPMAAWLVGKTEADVLAEAEARGWRRLPRPHTVDLYLDHLREERRCDEAAVTLQTEDLYRLTAFAHRRDTKVEALDTPALKAFMVEQCPEGSIRDLHTFATILEYYRFLLLERHIEKNPAAEFEKAIDAIERGGQ